MNADTTTTRLGPHEIALLRAGPRAAVTVAVVALHLRGAVAAGRPGTLRRTAPRGDGAFRHPLEKAVRTALYRPAGPRELLGRAVVRRALARMRAEAAAAGLLRPLPPRRTRACRRRLAALRAGHPLPASADGLPEEHVLLAVALHGDRALTVLLPGFARAAGLTARGTRADRDGVPFGRGTGSHLRFGYEGYEGYDDDDTEGSGGPDHSAGKGYGCGGFGCGGGGGGD
jgi:uncharacterized protein (TIGR04222 family)